MPTRIQVEHIDDRDGKSGAFRGPPASRAGFLQGHRQIATIRASLGGMWGK